MMEQVSDHARGRSDPGVIIFNYENQLTFANQISWDIFKTKGKKKKLSIPSHIVGICDELKNKQRKIPWSRSPRSVFLKKNVVVEENQYTVRGFIVGGRRKNSFESFLLLIDRVVLRSQPDLEQVRFRFKLSHREFQVVKLLTMGMTNKEIANALQIVESTVKEYMNKVMQKLKVNTRAGVVSRVFYPPDQMPKYPLGSGAKFFMAIGQKQARLAFSRCSRRFPPQPTSESDALWEGVIKFTK